MSFVQELRAAEILDSRGRPTLKAWCRLDSGPAVSASVPSGASTGRAEAVELRDGDRQRYRGMGCRIAAGHVSNEIARAVIGREWTSQAELDEFLCKLDGTPNKSRLGANAILAVSLAFARASAALEEAPLYRYLSSLLGDAPEELPRLTVNLFSGGKHAGGQVAIQDVLLVPMSEGTIDGSLAKVEAVYHSAAEIVGKKYRARPLKADEGGLAPPFPNTDAMLQDAVEAISAAGLVPGKDMALAVDVASSHFYDDGVYTIDGDQLDSSAMIGMLRRWIEKYPIVSVEDGLAEEDWEYWPQLKKELGERCLVLGDDFLCTNPDRIRRAVKSSCATALLLKVNQIGTLSEALAARCLARQAGWQVTVSARSGETEDNWLADLAVGWGGNQIKVGSICQSERLAKYNRLLEIEAETRLPVVAWP